MQAQTEAQQPKVGEVSAPASSAMEEQARGEASEVPAAEQRPCQQQRWYSIVECLTKEALGQDEVQRLLSEAVESAKADDQWANSGMLQLLVRARDTSVNGFTESARKAALGLLDFRAVVERSIAQFRLSSSSGEDKKCGSASSSDANDIDTAAAGTRSPRQPGTKQHSGDSGQHDNTTVYVSEDTGTVLGDVDSGLAGHKRRRSIADHIPTEEHPEIAVQLSQEPLATWTGAVKLQQLGGADVDFCSLSMQVPASFVEDLPSELKVSTIRQRRGLMTKGQLPCETEILGANRLQMAQLRKMAQMELVALMPLEDCGAILVPYLTKSGGIKAVTFLAAMEG